MGQWISPTAIHTYRGKGYPHRCELCGWQLQEGQQYERYIMRVGNGRRSHFMIIVRHYNEYDCGEELFCEELVEQSVPIAEVVQQVVSSRQVILIGVDGKTIVETVPVTESVTTGTARLNLISIQMATVSKSLSKKSNDPGSNQPGLSYLNRYECATASNMLKGIILRAIVNMICG